MRLDVVSNEVGVGRSARAEPVAARVTQLLHDGLDAVAGLEA